MQGSATAPRASFFTPVVCCILITETAERFSYFGFRAILVLYFTRALEYQETTAIALFAYMTCLAYLSPILGALLADAYWGRYTTILVFGCIYAIGLVILTGGAFTNSSNLDTKRILTFLGLFLVCLGTGGIKPCVSAFGADQVANQGQEEGSRSVTEDSNGLEPLSQQGDTPVSDSESRVRAFFASFYFCINLGAVTSIFMIPILRANFGFGAAFLTPTIFIVLAMLAFVSKSKEYVHHDLGETSLATTFFLCGWLLRKRLSNVRLIHTYFPCIRPSQYPLSSGANESLANNEECNDNDADTARNQQLSDAAQALHVMPIMGMLPIFWMLYDQQGSVWTLQATRMALHGLQPEQLNVVNPVEIMIFIPLFDRCIYPAMERRGWNISHLRRMGWGMLLASMSFFISGVLESVIQSREAEGGAQVHVFWQLPQITTLAVAEIFLSVTGLEFAYATSPDRLKAFLMAIYLLTTSVGDFFGGLLYSSIFQQINRATVMHVCAVLMLGNLGLFCCVATWWERAEAGMNAASGARRLSQSSERGYESLARTTSFKGVEMKRQTDAVIT
jgi:dipeptide/tripeptide permease